MAEGYTALLVEGEPWSLNIHIEMYDDIMHCSGGEDETAVTEYAH